jgi:hypothetical protein
LSFFLSFFFSFIIIFSLIFLSHKIFYLLPFWTLKIASYLPPPMLKRCSSSSKEAIKKVGTGNIFFLERYLICSMLTPSCDLPWIDDPFSMIGCGQGGNHKRWYLVLRVDIQRGLWDLQCGDAQCTDKRLAKR